MGVGYFVAATVLGAVFVKFAVDLRRSPEETSPAMRLFHYSISYLGLLFAAMFDPDDVVALEVMVTATDSASAGSRGGR